MSKEKIFWWAGVLVILQLFVIVGLTFTGSKIAPIAPVRDADAQCIRFFLYAGNNACPACPSGATQVSCVQTGTVAVYGGTATRWTALCSQ